ncbi:MAG TPA: aldehyde dehydrogenase (NADP(+)), partial [Flavisolibacter sp.]|nr:aldehyde dehydrogenase (NADP(+)) [Flavisolibacter sp.]
MKKFQDASIEEIEDVLHKATDAFSIYRKSNGFERSNFLYAIAARLISNEEVLIELAHKETHLERGRLKLELQRTVFQLRTYGHAAAQGFAHEIRIDKAQTNPFHPDLRKMNVPLGPVLVFGASNFPFAYSTAGGDTACALAAGCTVIVKAHPAHAETSESVSSIIQQVAMECQLPEGVFSHIHGTEFEIGERLVMHPLVKAVGFTGSLSGGKALFDLSNRRLHPIPVFAEMGSTNPVFILPEKLKEGDVLSKSLLHSITQSAGQFCTNPGLLVVLESEQLPYFEQSLAEGMAATAPVAMLHDGIAKHFRQIRTAITTIKGVEMVAVTAASYKDHESIPTLAKVSAEVFIQNPSLRQEVFGPFSMLVICKNKTEMLKVATVLDGQLTCTLMGTNEEIKAFENLLDQLQAKCGRLILNGVPTGVEVAHAMHHGGPYPATTDSRFT